MSSSSNALFRDGEVGEGETAAATGAGPRELDDGSALGASTSTSTRAFFCPTSWERLAGRSSSSAGSAGSRFEAAQQPPEADSLPTLVCLAGRFLALCRS